MKDNIDYIKGMTWGWVGQHGTWNTAEGEESLRAMSRLGVTWTAIAFQGLQDAAHATKIHFNEAEMIRDEEIVWAVAKSHELGIKVCLKPVVNCKDGTWRAFINFFDKDVPREPSWTDWFMSYEGFILHYAQLAERTNCEMFCVGCEMVMADRRESDWRELIRKVREVYHGPITYNCDKYQEENVIWWDAVDIVSSSGYYPTAEWSERTRELEKFVASIGKPFFFMETGCPSRSGSGQVPNDWSHEGVVDLEEQASFYRAMFDAIGKENWFHGFMLWDWPANLYPIEQAVHNDDYCVYGKPAADVIRNFYHTNR